MQDSGARRGSNAAGVRGIVRKHDCALPAQYTKHSCMIAGALIINISGVRLGEDGSGTAGCDGQHHDARFVKNMAGAAASIFTAFTGNGKESHAPKPRFPVATLFAPPERWQPSNNAPATTRTAEDVSRQLERRPQYPVCPNSYATLQTQAYHASRAYLVGNRPRRQRQS